MMAGGGGGGDQQDAIPARYSTMASTQVCRSGIGTISASPPNQICSRTIASITGSRACCTQGSSACADIAKQGSTGLFRALARGVALPAVAVVPVMELLQERGQQGE